MYMHAFVDTNDGISNKWPQISDVHKCHGLVCACNSANMQVGMHHRDKLEYGTVIMSCLLGHVTASREMS